MSSYIEMLFLLSFFFSFVGLLVSFNYNVAATRLAPCICTQQQPWPIQKWCLPNAKMRNCCSINHTLFTTRTLYLA